jgi:hypothetical protein
MLGCMGASEALINFEWGLLFVLVVVHARLVADFCYDGVQHSNWPLAGRHKVVFLGLAMKFVINMLFMTIC